MLFRPLLYLALAVFGLGLVYKISTWFTHRLAEAPRTISAAARLFSALKGVLSTLLSLKIITLLRVFVLDVLLQTHILKQSFLRWLMHMLIFWGFMLLLLMHALGHLVVAPVFGEYDPTQNPYFFLRDLFGAMVFVGLGIAVYRRFILKVPRLKTGPMDMYAIVILAAIMLSGVLLEGMKITSYSEFDRMVQDYADDMDESEKEALESLWIQEFGLVSAHVQGPFEPEVLELGLESHEMYCMDCHASAKWAFSGYALAKLSGPLAVLLDRAHAVDILWYIHILGCFAGLAFLPFSKMFHIIATPISLMANAVMADAATGVNVATRQALELDACTNCGTCSLLCAAKSAFDVTGNELVLPSRKLAYLKQLAAGKKLTPEALKVAQEGLYLCTNCDRCTLVCPSGIRLKEIWFNAREALFQKGRPEPLILSGLSFSRGVQSEQIPADQYQKPIQHARQLIADASLPQALKCNPIRLNHVNKVFKKNMLNSLQGKTVTFCYTCTSCTSECPVVRNYDNPKKALDLLPHQIIRAAVLGLGGLAFNANMLWSCTGCYRCQEICPQRVHITDIFFELKSLAIKHASQETGSAHRI